VELLLTIVLVLWIAIFVQTIANLATVPRLRPDQTPQNSPFVSIVVPARDEARTIERSARAFLAQDYGNFEVIVVNDRSSDATGDILRSITDPRLTVIDGAEPSDGWLGKPWALEQATARARGELLLIVDADLVYAPETLRAAVAAMESEKAALITLLPHFEMGSLGEQIAMPMLALVALSMLPLWRVNRSRTPRLALGGGSGILIRRDVFDAVDGFRPLKGAVVDDVGLARHVREHGEATRAILADDLVRVRMYHSTRGVIEGFTKNMFMVIERSYLAGLFWLALVVIGHLGPYALALTGDGVAIAIVAVITLNRVVLFRALRYPLLNALFLHPFMMLLWAWILLRSMWFTGVRNELRWRGRVYNAAETRFGAER